MCRVREMMLAKSLAQILVGSRRQPVELPTPGQVVKSLS